MDVDIDLMDVDIDPKILEMEGVGLDPRKTMDFAILKILNCRFIQSPGSSKSMGKFLKLGKIILSGSCFR